MKPIRTFLIAACMLGLSTGARAGIPVIDAANLMQSVLEVVAWIQQAADMVSQLQNQVQQINTAKDTLTNMTGQRMLGMASNNLSNNALVPANVSQAWAGYKKGVDIVNAAKQLGTQGQTTSDQRWQQLQSLMGLINSTQDAKAAQEIQARIQAENAAIANDANRIALLKMQAEAEAQRIQEDLRAAHNAQTASAAETSANFANLFALGQ
jgi:type IV secretion system protein VirB5